MFATQENRASRKSMSCRLASSKEAFVSHGEASFLLLEVRFACESDASWTSRRSDESEWDVERERPRFERRRPPMVPVSSFHLSGSVRPVGISMDGLTYSGGEGGNGKERFSEVSRPFPIRAWSTISQRPSIHILLPRSCGDCRNDFESKDRSIPCRTFVPGTSWSRARSLCITKGTRGPSRQALHA